MWTRVSAAVDGNAVRHVIECSKSIASVCEDRHFVKAGKTFFHHRLDLLRETFVDLDRSLNIATRLHQPAINHAFLLFKSAGGPATKAHQDRAYWLDIEDSPTMFTAWIALDDISADMGALGLSAASEVTLDGFFTERKAQQLLPHQQDQYGGGGFTTTLEDEIADELGRAMTVQPVQCGDAILFDAFEPHISTANLGDRTRLAMKIVIGEGRSMNDHLISVEKLKRFRPPRRLWGMLQRPFRRRNAS